MYAPLRWAIRDIRKFFVLTDKERQLYLVDPLRNFTRNRLLSFPRTAAIILSLLKKASA